MAWDRSSPVQASRAVPPRRNFDAVFFTPFGAPLVLEHRGRPSVSTGGAERQVWMVARGLAARGHRVALLAYQIGEPLPPACAGVELLPMRRPPPRRAQALRVIDYAFGAGATLARASAPSYVQRSAGPETALVGIVARARRARFVYSSSSRVDFEFGRLERRRVRLAAFRLGLRIASTLVVQNDEQRELCRARLGRDGMVIPSAVELVPECVREPEEMVWVGRLAAYKRPETLIELARAVPEARFTMVATPAASELGAEADLQRAASALPNLRILGPLPRQELLDLLGRAVAVVSTSEYEGMPNVLLEGWARGVPALVLEHDPNGVVAREGVGSLAHGSVERLAALARDAWNRRHDDHELSRRCRTYARREHALDEVLTRWETALGLTGGGPE